MSELLVEGARSVDEGAVPVDEEIEATIEEAVPKRRRRPGSIAVKLAIGWLTIVILATILQPWLPIDDYRKSDYLAVAVPPLSSGHILGTDEIGRDMLARLIVGARVSLLVGFGAITIATIIGSLLGMVAGYFRGLADRVISGLVDVILAFPGLVALVALSVFLGNSMSTIIIGIGFIGWPAVARVTRSATITYANRDFVTAARGTGASSWRVLRRELLPNVAVPVLSYGVIFVAIAIIAEGGLSFIGLGVPPPTSSWGSMLGGGRNELATHPHVVLVPATVMFLTLLALNYLGDYIGKRFDIRESLL